MKRYERIKEIREGMDWKDLAVEVRHTPLYMIDAEVVQKADEKQAKGIATLRRTLEALQELKELTGIEAIVSNTQYRYSTIGMTTHDQHIYALNVSHTIWFGVIASQEVCVADGEEVEKKQKEKWERLTPLEKLEKIVVYLEADTTLRDQITFLEEEI